MRNRASTCPQPLLVLLISTIACALVATATTADEKKKPASRSEAAVINGANDGASGDEMPEDEKPAKKRAPKSATKGKAKDDAGKGGKKDDAKKDDAKNDPLAKTDHSGEGRGYDKQAGLSLVPPEGWQRATATQTDRLRFFAPQPEPAQSEPPQSEPSQAAMFVTVTKDDGTDYEKLAAIVKDHLPRLLQGWKLTSEGPLEVEGRPAYFVGSTFRVQNGETQQLQYFLRGDAGNFYTVTFTSDKGSFAKLKKSFQDCAKSIRCD